MRERQAGALVPPDWNEPNLPRRPPARDAGCAAYGLFRLMSQVADVAPPGAPRSVCGL